MKSENLFHYYLGRKNMLKEHMVIGREHSCLSPLYSSYIISKHNKWLCFKKDTHILFINLLSDNDLCNYAHIFFNHNNYLWRFKFFFSKAHITALQRKAEKKTYYIPEAKTSSQGCLWSLCFKLYFPYQFRKYQFTSPHHDWL